MQRVLFLVVVVAAVAAGCGPKQYEVPLPNIKATDDAEVIARGEYLFHGAAHCSACHNTKETYVDMKAGEKPLPVGGGVWKMGPLGTLRAPNLTPDPETGIGRYSDEQLARVLRDGIAPDGTLSGFMRMAAPRLAEDDIRAVISYMRSLPPTKNEVEKSELSGLAHMAFGGIAPKRPWPEKSAPPIGATVERGRYLAEGAAACIGCHSGLDMGAAEVIPGTEFAGSGEPMEGELEDDPNEYRAPNLTPDPETGIAGKWTEEQFLARMKAGRVHRGSPMPWNHFASMQDDDIKAIWLFLQTVPPVKNDTGPTVVPKG